MDGRDFSGRTYICATDRVNEYSLTGLDNVASISAEGYLVKDARGIGLSKFVLKNCINNINAYNDTITIRFRNEATLVETDITVTMFHGLYNAKLFYLQLCQDVNTQLAGLGLLARLGYDQCLPASPRPCTDAERNKMPNESSYRLFTYYEAGLKFGDFTFRILSGTMTQFGDLAFGFRASNTFRPYFICYNISLYYTKYVDILSTKLTQFTVAQNRANNGSDMTLLYRYFFDPPMLHFETRGFCLLDADLPFADETTAANTFITGHYPQCFNVSTEPHNINFIGFDRDIIREYIDISLFDSYNQPILLPSVVWSAAPPYPTLANGEEQLFNVELITLPKLISGFGAQ